METQIRVPVGSPVIAEVPIFVDEHNVTEGAMKLIKELRPAWDTSHVTTKVRLAANLALLSMLGYFKIPTGSIAERSIHGPHCSESKMLSDW